MPAPSPGSLAGNPPPRRGAPGVDLALRDGAGQAWRATVRLVKRHRIDLSTLRAHRLSPLTHVATHLPHARRGENAQAVSSRPPVVAQQMQLTRVATATIARGPAMSITPPSFPNPVDEISARLVAGGVVLLATSYVLTGLVTAGRGARLRLRRARRPGPRFSPLGLVVTRWVRPRLPVAPRPVAGTAQALRPGMGAVLSSLALVLACSERLRVPAWSSRSSSWPPP